MADRTSRGDWVDVGCGTGALTQTTVDHASPRSVKGVDPSSGFIEYAKARITDGRVNFEVGNAQSLPVDSASADAAVAGLVLNFLPQPLRAVMEMARVTRPGGVIAAYVWDYAEKLDPAAYELDEGRRFPICQP